LVAALNECVHAVLYSSTEVYFSDIVQLNEIFKTDYGRRQFAFALKQTMKKVQTFLFFNSYSFSQLRSHTFTFSLLIAAAFALSVVGRLRHDALPHEPVRHCFDAES
jgi:hypothetical protein